MNDVYLEQCGSEEGAGMSSIGTAAPSFLLGPLESLGPGKSLPTHSGFLHEGSDFSY